MTGQWQRSVSAIDYFDAYGVNFHADILGLPFDSLDHGYYASAYGKFVNFLSILQGWKQACYLFDR